MCQMDGGALDSPTFVVIIIHEDARCSLLEQATPSIPPFLVDEQKRLSVSQCELTKFRIRSLGAVQRHADLLSRFSVFQSYDVPV